MPIRPACELSMDEAKTALDWAADVAVRSEQPVTFLGLSGMANLPRYCRARCQFDHPGSVVVVPDLVMAELMAQGWEDTPTKMLTRGDGATVWLYKVNGST